MSPGGFFLGLFVFKGKFKEIDKNSDMNYIGIDVGAEKYFVVWYSDVDRHFQKSRFNNCKELPHVARDKNCIIAIDAPSSCRKHKNKRRSCEEKLGIGGYFATPFDRKAAKSWMVSGFKLWESLLDKGFKRATSRPVKKDYLIEVHPTLIFKKMMNPNVGPKLWISRKNPISKSKSKGKDQRRRLLRDKFPKQCKEIDRFNIDYIDALIAAYTAEQSYKGDVDDFGDSDEGQIWLPA